MAYTPEVFNDLVAAYLSTGAGIAGMQPKIMVPDRPTVPIPSLIVKAASAAYPGLAANEFLCLTAAKQAGIDTPTFELSDDGQMLVLDRFDLVAREDGHYERLGFEDIAALAGLAVTLVRVTPQDVVELTSFDLAWGKKRVFGAWSAPASIIALPPLRGWLSRTSVPMVRPRRR